MLYRIEHFFQQLTSAAYIYNGIPFIYSEDNIAFKKEKYFELGGYGKNIKEPYANLELLVNSFIKKKSTLLNFAAETSIKKELEIGRAEYKDLLNKSIRIENYLPLWKKIFLFTDRFTELLFLPLLTLCLVFSFQLILLIYIPVAVLFVAKVLIIKITLNRLNERKIFISSLVYGLLMPYYKMIYKWRFCKSSRKYKWNKAV